jgi:hypothetical protein
VIDLEDAIDLYTQLIGCSPVGNRELDRRLAVWLTSNVDFRGGTDAFSGDAGIPFFTTSVDAATEFLTAALPGYEVHELHGWGTSWYCQIRHTGNAADSADGTGRTGPLAILSAAVTGLIAQRLLHWNRKGRERPS